MVFTTRLYAYPTPVDFDGKLMRWNINSESAPITYGVVAENPDDAAYYQSKIDEAAQLWSRVPGSYFKYAPASNSKDAQVTINLRSSLSGERDSSGYTVFDSVSGDSPSHCSIYVLLDPGYSEDAISKVFLHELGHGLGLGHSLIPAAIMSYSLDENGFGLDLDDDAAVAHSYPSDGHSPRLPPGCAVLANTHSVLGTQATEAHWWSFGATLLLLTSPLLFSLWPTCGRWRAWREPSHPQGH
jgi:hypothetical protein